MKYTTYLLIALFFIFNLPAYAKLQQIPETYLQQYQEEIEQLVSKQIPKTKRAINNVENIIKTENNLYIKQVTIEQGINSLLFTFFMDLINITDKYIAIKKDLPATDYYLVLKDIIIPYLEQNSINTKKIDSLLKYANKKQVKLEKKYLN